MGNNVETQWYRGKRGETQRYMEIAWRHTKVQEK
jgi:hypothetical protein